MHLNSKDILGHCCWAYGGPFLWEFRFLLLVECFLVFNIGNFGVFLKTPIMFIYLDFLCLSSLLNFLSLFLLFAFYL